MIRLLKEIKRLNKNLENIDKSLYEIKLREKLEEITRLYKKCREDDYKNFKGNYTDVSLKLKGQKELLEEILGENNEK